MRPLNKGMSIMTRQSSVKATIGSVLGSVTSVATSVGSLFDTAHGAIGMLNTAVITASEKQAISTDYEMASYEDTCLNVTSIEQARQKREITRFFEEAPENKAMFEETYASVQEQVAARRKARAGQRA
jgi:hypothetical protein